MYRPFDKAIPVLRIYARYKCISASSRIFITTLLEIMEKLAIAMYTTEGWQRNKETHGKGRVLAYFVPALP